MTSIQWDTQQFYQPSFVILLFLRNYSFFSRNSRIVSVNTISRRPPEAAIPIERDEITAVYNVA
jgi:hypothetical protein